MIGALVARLNLRGAEDGLRAFTPGKAYLLTLDGTLIASSHMGSSALMRTRLQQKTLDRLKAREGKLVSYESVDGTDVVGSLKRVPRAGWAILAEMPAVSAIAYRLGVLIVHPLERLTKGASEVANGDLAVDLPAAKGEVGDLTLVFNHMVQRLRHGRQELDAVNEMLRAKNEELEQLSIV